MIDPDEKLERIRELLAQIDAKVGVYDAYPEVGSLGDAFEALDSHLSRGGIPPRAWLPAPFSQT